ncbi:EscU/YscU/HrcU family type III secretion system export apparatus switch protein [Chromohalobacter canadensis]|uniref:Flagellar biosynthetic protein FlhB n=1 Tax=Chromohalobacter moromii TaxID=2860329 RepID=A0A9X3B4F3_9GAMM|nr:MULTISPECIES: EscU/YscU/HrcU family type III secretion system export apparatus switch protein [Chromohalobacter]MCT8469854.1 EscU/YscU/HrcU family type III secretion system export apparatus switch protein [Chromohalobacter canadensis]MCT8472312.1 EscU/YscU/HrcU family type III secretion system export apparatus switch protein [Chromohalobacter canadensis]MCT8499576.1 EscU/YscU/HrcU family type III secretion system export apparatus switch protein [Chromohalobacter canadensis]MCT8505889.1 EscU/
MSDTPDERRRAVALAYQDPSAAPVVVAKGYGDLAERIVSTAKNDGIFVHDAPELVALLMQVDLDAQIPPMLYQVIAELLAWVYDLEREEASLNSESGTPSRR